MGEGNVVDNCAWCARAGTPSSIMLSVTICATHIRYNVCIAHDTSIYHAHVWLMWLGKCVWLMAAFSTKCVCCTQKSCNISKGLMLASLKPQHLKKKCKPYWSHFRCLHATAVDCVPSALSALFLNSKLLVLNEGKVLCICSKALSHGLTVTLVCDFSDSNFLSNLGIAIYCCAIVRPTFHAT